MGIQRSPEPGENDADYLYEWGLHGLGIDKFNSLDAPGERYQRSYLMRSVPDVTVMLRSGFKPDDFSHLKREIPLSMYSEAWQHGIHPKILNRAYNVGSLQESDLQSNPSKVTRQRHRLFPTVNEGAAYGEKTIIPGNLGHFVSSMIAGATPQEALDAHRTLLPYATSAHYTESDEPEQRFHVPLDEYAKFRKSGGTHEEFKQIFSAVSSSHAKRKVNTSTPIARESLRNILSNYSDYRKMGLDHREAGKALAEFSKGTSPLMVTGDGTFRKAIKNGATSDEYWDANTKNIDMEKYAEDRKTKSHDQSIKRNFNISSLF